MSRAHYPFASGNYLELRPNYTYCDCSGEDFLAVWIGVRKHALERLAMIDGPTDQTPAAKPDVPADGVAIHDLLDRIERHLATAEPIAAATEKDINLLVQRFEVGKRLYGVYRGADRRGDTNSGYREITRYVRFGEILMSSFERTQALPQLNALLKLCDLLCAHVDEISGQWRLRTAQLLAREVAAVAVLATEQGLPWPA
jgi:hypothetical protein